MVFSRAHVDHLLPGHTGLLVPEDPWIQIPVNQETEDESSQAKERERALTRGAVRAPNIQ